MQTHHWEKDRQHPWETDIDSAQTVHAWLGCSYNGKRFQNPE